MSLNDLIAADALAVFCAGDGTGFDEPVVYIKKSTGAERTINAQVYRDPPERFDAAGNMTTPRLMIEVANDATRGISAAELNAYGNDKIRVTWRGTSYDFGVYIPGKEAGEWQDAGMLRLDLK